MDASPMGEVVLQNIRVRERTETAQQRGRGEEAAGRRRAIKGSIIPRSTVRDNIFTDMPTTASIPTQRTDQRDCSQMQMRCVHRKPAARCHRSLGRLHSHALARIRPRLSHTALSHSGSSTLSRSAHPGLLSPSRPLLPSVSADIAQSQSLSPDASSHGGARCPRKNGPPQARASKGL